MKKVKETYEKLSLIEKFTAISSSILVFLLLILLIIALSSCSKIWNSYPSDNIFEEITEEIIEYKTGSDVDLSPFSPEK